MGSDGFVEAVTRGVCSLPQDMKALLRIFDDPEIDDQNRQLLAGALIHVLSAHNAIPGQRGILAHVDDFLVLHLALERVEKANPEAIARHREDLPELFEPHDEHLARARTYLGDLMIVLDEAVNQCPNMSHHGHAAKDCLNEEGATWLYDAVQAIIVEELEFDEEEVAREVKNVDRILPHLKSRVTAMKGG